eukprot:RCo052299
MATRRGTKPAAAVVSAEDGERLEWEILKQCIASTSMSESLTSALSVHTLVLQAIVYQCLFVARTMHRVKAMASAWETSKDSPDSVLPPLFPPSAMAASPMQVHIGIIGCGTVGSALLNGLLGCGLFHKTCFTVSTRQPHLLELYRDAGVRCCYDNRYAAEQSDLLFLCCLPGHLKAVVAEIEGHLPKHTVVMSVAMGVFAETLSGMLSHPFVITTYLKTYLVSEHFNNDQHPVDEKDKDRDLALLTCPFDDPEFFFRLTLSLVAPWHQRGFSVEKAFTMALKGALNRDFALPMDLAQRIPTLSPRPDPLGCSLNSSMVRRTSPKKLDLSSSVTLATLEAPKSRRQGLTSRWEEVCSAEYVSRYIFRLNPSEWLSMLRARYAEVCLNTP